MIMPLADEVRTVGHMRITFHRFPDHSSAYSVIERDDGVVYRMKEFTRAGIELPHDLRHFVVERELGITNGIWGGITAGMVYTSMDHVRGRRPPHSAERSDRLMRAQRQPLMRAELLANLVEAIAMLDDPRPGGSAGSPRSALRGTHCRARRGPCRRSRVADDRGPRRRGPGAPG